MTMPHTIDIVGDEMIVLDEEGNGCDCCRLVGSRAAKRQLRRWQEEYAFDYAGTMSAVLGYFSSLAETPK